MFSAGFRLSRFESLKVHCRHGCASRCARTYAPSLAYLYHWDIYNFLPDLGKYREKGRAPDEGESIDYFHSFHLIQLEPFLNLHSSNHLVVFVFYLSGLFP